MAAEMGMADMVCTPPATTTSLTPDMIACAAVAALLFQGMVREALFAKCIYRSPRYRDMELEALIDHLLELFFRAVGYSERPAAVPGGDD